MSMVKIVAVELSIEAKDDTIAADNAARTNPFSPVGIKLLINQGAALSLIMLPLSPIKVGSMVCVVTIPSGPAFNTYATIPGTTTIRGINNFRNAAKAIPF